ncbi:putative carboxypeptidase D [Helianthus annuus]|nr:putative carboxypeptidase D [Helianthus annuus]
MFEMMDYYFCSCKCPFLGIPAGVGFSYSNKSTDYTTDDVQAAKDSYTFLINWLERFPEYKTRDFYITGESYAGHYVPQLAQLVLQNNKITNQTVINLEGIAIGNPYVDYEAEKTGMFDYFWTHAIISDQNHEGIISNCNFTEGAPKTDACKDYQYQAYTALSNIFPYDIYTPLCSPFSNSTPSVRSDLNRQICRNIFTWK